MPDMTASVLNAQLKLVQEFASMQEMEWMDLYALHRLEDFL